MIKKHIIPDNELEITAIRAQGAGGQNVNKVSSAIHLRFNTKASSLPIETKKKLLRLRDRRITRDGYIVIKAQQFRTQERNRDDAIARLQAVIQKAMQTQKKRIATKPSRVAKERRLMNKSKRAKQKKLRHKHFED